MHALVLVGFIVVCFAVAYLGSLANRRSIPTWYAELKRPAWTPPNSVFGPVWTILYLMMAIAAWRCWLVSGFASWLLPFSIQLGLNLAWSWIFFAYQKLGLGLIEIIALWASIFWCLMTFFSIDNVAGILLIPYLLWVTYALSLNAGFWVLNRKLA